MGILLSIIALLIALTGGVGAVLLFRSRGSHLDVPGVVGTGMILGVGVVAISSFFLGLLVQGAMLRLAVTAICAGLAVYGWRRNGWTWPDSPKAPRLPQIALFAMAAMAVCFVTWFSLYRAGLDWDGLFNWESKARVAFLNQGAIPLRYYTTNYDFFHRSYPPLIPLFESWIYGFLGRMDQSLVKLVGPYFYLAAALLLISFANRERKGRWTAILVVLPMVLVPHLTMGGGSASSGYADFPLAAIYLCAVVHGLEYWRTRSLESARLAGLSAMLLPFTKADGLVPLMCFIVAMAPLIVQDWIAKERNWKTAAWLLAPGAGLWLVWKTFLTVTGVPRELDFAGFTPAILFSHLDRTLPLLGWAFEELTDWKRWSLLWPVAVAGFVSLAMRARRREWFPWAGTVMLPLLLYPCIYFFSAWDPVEAHVKSSLPRLYVQIAPVAALMAGAAFAQLMDAARRTGELSAEDLENLFQAAGAILQPMGMTVQQVRQAYDQRLSERLLEQAAEVLRPTGVKVEHLRRVYENAQAESRPPAEEPPLPVDPVIEAPAKAPVKDRGRRKTAV